ncbi:MAG: hypothetical protein JWN86_1069 [Planctomycetota bacterium]|nr:hypothetical protein [Planctomycetota bacterium]
MAQRFRLNVRQWPRQRWIGIGLISASLLALGWWSSLFLGGGETPVFPLPMAESPVEPSQLPQVLDDDFLYGARGDDDLLVKIDPRTGTATRQFEMGLRLGVEELVMDPSGRIFGIAGILTGYLFRVTPETGKTVKIADISGASKTYKVLEAMAFVDGVLYASASSDDSYCGDCANHLIKLDLATGKASEIGTFGPDFLNIEAMAYSPRHGLIGADIGTLIGPDFREFHTRPALVRIDLSSGQATKIGDLPPKTDVLVPNATNNKLSPFGPFLCGMTFAPDGTLYASTFPTHFGGDSRLVRVNPETASVIDVGSMGLKNVDGIVYVRPRKPTEPKTGP